MKNRANPLFPSSDITLNLETLRSPTVFRSKKPSSKKIIRRLTRGENAITALGTLTPGQDIFGFTKGQFSLLDLIAAVNDQIGPCKLVCSTWTAANADLDHVAAFVANSKLSGARFILDFTFQRRQPAIAKKLRDTFGPENIRVTRNHSKFALLTGPQHRIVLKTSMNLNTNPRFENFEISWDPDLYEFLNTLTEEIFGDHQNQEAMETAELMAQFNDKE